MYQYPNVSLSVFSKVPEFGKVKTRMQTELPREFSLDLHKSMMTYVLNRCTDSNILPVSLWLTGEEQLFKKQFPTFRELDIFQQWGDHLGERLSFCVQQQLKRYSGVVLIGTDCPFIDKVLLQTVSRALNHHEMVVVPAEDGGYVLLALKAFYPDLFIDKSWGESVVLEQTMAVAARLNIKVKVLPSLVDIDRPDDLKSLATIDYFKPLLSRWGK